MVAGCIWLQVRLIIFLQVRFQIICCKLWVPRAEGRES